MRTWIKQCLARKAADKALLEEGGTLKFAFQITLRVVLLANMINLFSHSTLNYFHLLPYNFWKSLFIGSLSTVAISGGVGFLFAFYIGDAIRELSISRDMFEKLSSIDPLSQLLNRRSFFEATQPMRFGSLVVYDIDHFKKINDQFGHQVGDEVIRQVAVTLTEAFQSIPARIARLGGEEFAVLAWIEDKRLAYQTAEKALQLVACTGLQTGAGTITFTVSGGLADWKGDCSLEALYGRADEALYVAKAKGRNCVVHEDEMTDLIKLRVSHA